MLDRLSLVGRLPGIAADVRSVANLPDPVGEVFEESTLPNGLQVSKRRTPLGVLGVIYEARPNVTVDIAALALKTGNTAILRGGSETLRSNTELVDAIRAALASCGLPADSIQLICDPDRRYVGELLRLHQYVDMIIPRGGAGLHQFCRDNSSIPVITGGIGICHLFVDASADLDSALPVIYNAKVQRPSVCNSLDTLLVHESVAASFIPRVVEHLGTAGVTFKVDPGAAQFVDPDAGNVQSAGENDFDTEWLSLILGIRVVSNLDEAITHVQQHSTAHSDGILTSTPEHAERFLNEVDSAAVYVNASTRFTDGGQLGLGAEVAISTQKLHARGPMGLRELTTYKWIVRGDYHVRS
jgi:glutamate-5-semialdehyde dehydrogenase